VHVPNQPKTPALNARVPQNKQDALRRLAAEEGKTVTALVNEAIDLLLSTRQLGVDRV
jgi:uncharacterized protein (DUF1778 family)